MKKQKQNEKFPSSFRDPSGFLFKKEGVLLRQVNKIYQKDYTLLIKSGLSKLLNKEKLLIPHQEIDPQNAFSKTCYKVIQPAIVPFIAYPYEYCFSQLKEAALTTLKIQKIALTHGMTLKDASAYNIQFLEGKPVLIDTLSFEEYQDGEPWVAYRQFCQHFLAPLALASYKDVRLMQLLRIYIDGIPLDLTSNLLPSKSLVNTGLLSHLHLHAKTQGHFSDKRMPLITKKIKLSKNKLINLIDNLETTILNLKWKRISTEWGNYYKETNYTDKAFLSKKSLVIKFLNLLKPQSVWDLGANTGEFSRLSSDKGILTVAFDIDPLAVEQNYLQTLKNSETNLLPLVLDLTNPSPGLGWAGNERLSLTQRGPANFIFALALIHHLAISNNLPLENIAAFLAEIGQNIIIEFVPKEDSQVQKLLVTRKDIFDQYTQENFEKSFSKLFTIKAKGKIDNSERTLYLMQKKRV